MRTTDNFSTARKVSHENSKVSYPKKFAFKNNENCLREKVTASDKKLVFQSKIIVCESLQRYEQVIINS